MHVECTGESSLHDVSYFCQICLDTEMWSSLHCTCIQLTQKDGVSSGIVWLFTQMFWHRYVNCLHLDTHWIYIPVHVNCNIKVLSLNVHSVTKFIIDTKEMVAWMKGHESAIGSISVHGSGRYALTTSYDTAQLWDLDTFQRKRKLNIKEDVGIVQVLINDVHCCHYLLLYNVISINFTHQGIEIMYLYTIPWQK